MVTFYILKEYDNGSICGSFVSELASDKVKAIEDKADTTYLSNKDGEDKATIFFRLLQKEDPTFQPHNIVEIDF